MELYIISVISIIVITTIVYYKLSYKNGFLSSRAAFSIGISSIIISLAFPFVLSHINLLILNMLKNLSFSEEANIVFTLLLGFIIYLIMVCFLSIILSTIVIRKEIVFSFKGSDSINELMDGKNDFNYLNNGGDEHENFVDSKEIIDKMRLGDENIEEKDEKVEELEEIEKETADALEEEEAEEETAEALEEDEEETVEATEEEAEVEEEAEEEKVEEETADVLEEDEEETAEATEKEAEEETAEEEEETAEATEKKVEEETADVLEEDEEETVEATEEEEETAEVEDNNLIIDSEEKEKLESEIAGLIDMIEKEDEPSTEKETDEIEREDAGFVEKQTDIEHDNAKEFEEYVSKAFGYKKDDNFEEAILQFTFALDNAPDEESVFWIVLDICTVYKKMGQVDLAKDILESYVKEYGNSMNEYLIEQIKNNLQ